MGCCPKCGNKIEDNDKFCGKCGTKVENIYKVEKIEKIGKVDNSIVDDGKITDNKIQNAKKETTKENIIKNDINDDTKDNVKKDISDSTSVKAKENKREIKINKKFLIGGIISVITISLLVVFLFKDKIMYSHYMKKATNDINVSSKLSDYNKALKRKYTQEAVDSIYEVVKDGEDFREKISQVTSLDKEDVKKMIRQCAVYNAKTSFDKEDYKGCMKFLEEARKSGYDVKNFSSYEELLEKLNPEEKGGLTDESLNQYTYKNNNPTITDSYVNSLGNVYCKNDSDYSQIDGYIIPDSDRRYISESELNQYSKYALGLIRNEIYARHGYMFSDGKYGTYFNSKSWYVPDASFKGDDTEINDYEKQNAKLILSIEKKK